ncbi:MAG: M28 family peptidase, partial [Planctomycetes bacterium]|nr:M28 family peptidase [Planctomycetota bacterium]
MTSRQARLFAFSPLIAGLAAWLAGYLNAPQTRSAELSFDGTRAFADLEALVDTFGPRPTSLPKCERQAEWIRDRFREAGLEARVDHGEIDRLPLWNAVATLPGSGDRFIVVLGHHDTVSNAPGAEDNGSAVAALIELGRSLKGRSLRHTVLLCATDSEENGGQGAELLVKSLGPEGISRTDACIGLEMLGWEGGIPVLHALPRNFAAVVEGYVPAPLPAAIVNAAPESLAFADPYFSPIVQSLS